jgi:hypothetical protein
MLPLLLFLSLIFFSQALEIKVVPSHSPQFLEIRHDLPSWGKVQVRFISKDRDLSQSIDLFPASTVTLRLPIPTGQEGRIPQKVEVTEIHYTYKQQRKAGSFGSGPGQMRSPISISADAFDHIYAIDSSDDRILKFSRELRFLREYGSFNWDTSNSFKEDFSSIEEGQFDGARDLVSGPNLTFFVSDMRNNRIVELDLQGRFVREIIPVDEFDEPTVIEMNSRHEIAVLDSQKERIVLFNSFGQKLYTLGGYGKSRDRFQSPVDFVFNHRDELIVLDTKVPEIKRFSSASRFMGSKKLKDSPVGLALDPFGYVVVLYKDRLEFFTPTLDEVASPFKDPKEGQGVRDLCFTSNRHLYVLKDDPIQLIEFVPKLRIDRETLELSAIKP